MSSVVSRVKAAPSAQALEHFNKLLSFETDCWDVHFALSNKRQDFILLDVRGKESFDAGHIDGAVHLQHQKIRPEALEDYAMDTLFVVYCAGPHCNATEKAAIKLATLDRPVKKMIGGAIGWVDEGFTLTPTTVNV